MRIIFLFFLVSIDAFSQDTVFARHIIDTLSSETFFGRGYTESGLKKAKLFLVKQFEAAGLQPMDGKKFTQDLTLHVNTFPGRLSVKVNGRKLVPGIDYLVSPESRRAIGSYNMTKTDSLHYGNDKDSVYVTVVPKLTWSVSKEVKNYTTILILMDVVKSDIKQLDLDIENSLILNFQTANVCGLVKGTVFPDSVILFSAHYDHLGSMGMKTYFPGANDNASGVSLLLGLAQWYAKNPQPYSIGFICFTAEEAGLVGSEYYVKNPLFNLSFIRFLINLDLTGTGVEGITVVNATEFKKEFDLLKKINDEYSLLTAINSRGKAKNSDHYWFTENGVPSFFIYTLGGIKAYHDVHDVSATLPNNEYIDLFSLLKKFTGELMK